MDKIQIQQLLAKYYEGITTLEEEEVLLTYFKEEKDIDPELIPYKTHFELVMMGKAGFPHDMGNLENKIIDQITAFENEQKHSIRQLNFTRFLVAASVALMVGISGILLYKLQNKSMEDTYSDPKLAYLETQKTLLYISNKMNKGIEPLSNISKINTATENLQNLEKMDKSMSMLNLVSFINNSSNLKK